MVEIEMGKYLNVEASKVNSVGKKSAVDKTGDVYIEEKEEGI